MAIRYAVADGLWSNTATWDGGTLPASVDDVFANGKTVSIDQSITVNSLKKVANGTPAIAAFGVFQVTVAATVTITAGMLPGDGAGTDTRLLAVNAGVSAVTIVSPVITGGSTSRHGMTVMSTQTGIVTINANLGTQSAANPAVSIISGSTAAKIILNGNIAAVGSGGTGITDSGTNTQITVNGNINSGSNSYGIAVGVNCRLTVIGDLYGGFAGSSSAAVQVGQAGAVITVNGNIFGGSASQGISLVAANATVNVNGNVSGGSGSVGIDSNVNATGPVVTVTGTVNGGTGSSCHGVNLVGAPLSITVGGVVTGGTGASANSTHGIVASGISSTVIVNNNVFGGPGVTCLGVLLSAASSTITIVGNVTGGSGSAASVGVTVSSSSGLATVTGNVTGGAAANNYGISTAGGAVVRGTIRPGNGLAGAGCPAIITTGTGTARISGNIYGGGMIANTGPTGFFPITGIWGAIGTEEMVVHIYTAGAFPAGLATPITPLSRYGANLPLEVNVREGVTYGVGDLLIGTLVSDIPFTLGDIAEVFGSQLAAIEG